MFYSRSFRAASETLLEIAADPRHLGACIGVLAVLHTWSQNLRHHPDLHCLVPAGGLAFNNSRWIPTRHRGFFLPVRVLSRIFRDKLLAFLKRSYRRSRTLFRRQAGWAINTTRISISAWRLAPNRLGGLLQASVRRTRVCAEVPDPLQALRRHLQRQTPQPR